MAYLTNYNLSRLSQKLEIKTDVTMDIFLEHIFKDKEVFAIFNKSELKEVFIFKMLIDDEAKFMLEYYKEVPEREDSRTRVFNKGGKPKYHLLLNCQFLKQDYLDFSIPNDVQKLGNDVVDEYRKWFEENNLKELYLNNQIDKNGLILKFNEGFAKKHKIEPIVENSNLLIIEAPNSNSSNLNETFSIEDCKMQITNLKNQWFTAFPSRESKILAKHSYLFFKSESEINYKMNQLFSQSFVKDYDIIKLKEDLSIANSIVKSLIECLKNFIKWNYINKTNQEKSFDNLTLEKFGFECCHNCKSLHDISNRLNKIEQNNNQIPTNNLPKKYLINKSLFSIGERVYNGNGVLLGQLEGVDGHYIYIKNKEKTIQIMKSDPLYSKIDEFPF